MFKVLKWDKALARERRGFQLMCLGGETGIPLSTLVREKRVGRDEACQTFKQHTWTYVRMMEESLSYRFSEDVAVNYSLAVALGIWAIAGLPDCKPSTGDLWPI